MLSSNAADSAWQKPLLIALTGLLLSCSLHAAGQTDANTTSWFTAQGDHAAGNIRSAYAADSIARRNELIDEALSIVDELIRHPDAPPEVIRRSRYDRIMALRVRESMQAVLEEWQSLIADGYEPPAYVTVAAADARLYLRQPEKAADLYKQALAQDPERLETRHSMFWALLEQEDFDRALEVIDQVVEDTSGEPENAEHRQAVVTAAMGRAYANRLGDAQRRLEAIVEEDPDNVEAARALATIYRWRGWPDRAMDSLAPLLEVAPEQTGNRLLLAGLQRDLGRYGRAGAGLEQLHSVHPEDRHVQRDYRDWQTRERWSISAGGDYAESSNEASDFGSRERGWDLRVGAPWIGHYLQPYARIRYSDATFPEGQADYDRVGVGINWRRDRHHITLEGHRNRSGESQAGISAGYDWQAGDHWSFATRYESFSSDVPLRGRGQGLDGWKAEAAARWQAHESLYLRAGISRLDISDGNVRLAALGTLRHRLRASAHHVTDGTFDAYSSRASQSGGPYFNPDRDASLTYIVQHDWLTWRRYERSFTQRFTLGGGGYWQEAFGTHAIGLVRYEQLWQLSSHWFIRYGIGVASRVYDGDRETRVDGQFRLEGVF